jgi:HK97 family phage major capsid protein
MKLRDMLDKRAALAAQMRAILDKASSEKRGLNAEEQANYDAAFTDQDALRSTIERHERQAALEGEIGGQRSLPGNGEPNTAVREVRAIDAKEHRYALRTKDAGALRRATSEYGENFRHFLATGEIRALDAVAGGNGGYTVAPVQFVQDLIRAVDDLVFIRKFGTVRPVVTAEALGAVSLDADPADADWTSELAVGGEDSTMAFGKRELRPHPLAKLIKVSNKLMRASMLNIDSLVMERMAYKVAIPEEKGFLTGSGAGQPLGIFTASADGIPTTRDVATDNAATAVTMDGLRNAKFALKAGYLKKAVWGFHRDGVLQISKLKDSQNRYLWEPSTQIGEPDRLLGVPVFMSEYIPNTFTTGKYVGFIGDLTYYWIADALDLQVQRLVELFATTNQTGFIVRKETDGQPVLGEAFARVKLG